MSCPISVSFSFFFLIVLNSSFLTSLHISIYMHANISYYHYKNLICISDPAQIKATTMDPIQIVHVKLMASDLLFLTIWPSNPPCITKKGRPVSRAETVGIMVSRERKDKFLTFPMDDGSGCIPCILWLNHYYLTSHGGSSNLNLIAEMTQKQSKIVRLGELVRVRGRITIYRGMLQITVRDVVVERDPNADVLHWLDCIRLAKLCYDLLPAATLSGSVMNPPQDGSDCKILRFLQLCYSSCWCEISADAGGAGVDGRDESPRGETCKKSPGRRWLRRGSSDAQVRISFNRRSVRGRE